MEGSQGRKEVQLLENEKTSLAGMKGEGVEGLEMGFNFLCKMITGALVGECIGGGACGSWLGAWLGGYSCSFKK